MRPAMLAVLRTLCATRAGRAREKQHENPGSGKAMGMWAKRVVHHLTLDLPEVFFLEGTGRVVAGTRAQKQRTADRGRRPRVLGADRGYSARTAAGSAPQTTAGAARVLPISAGACREPTKFSGTREFRLRVCLCI